MTSIPTLVLIDRAGTVWAVHLGAGEAVLDALRDEIDALLDGLPRPSPTGDR
ncbi:hypothetical protein [Tautonia plasticadhaerens]|uniref:hypothetical protein n=1 Tax=Tautonia plasticadhaerens TaxID=2527974 RepID=UPI0018D23B0D|nr:hypothetical protein [Tautonia plasticadhaerens]